MSLKLKICNILAWNADTLQIGHMINMETPLGVFQVLPRELLHTLFDRISGSSFLIFVYLILLDSKILSLIIGVIIQSSKLL